MKNELADNDYSKYLAELEKLRLERVKFHCKKGLHSWAHYYNFARCSDCGEMMDTHTPGPYLDD